MGGMPPLILAATPIGNPGDASARLRAALESADVVAAEDTRRLFWLRDALGVRIPGRVVSYHEHNEASRTQDLLDAVARGEQVLVVTDAGMPSVSDPGFRAVAAAVEADLPVTCLPGPSAVLTALALSGLPVDRFCFEGFLPRKSGERARALAALADERRTMVLFEAPHRLAETLTAMAEAFGPTRRAAVCRELTKTYEEVVRGPLAELAEWAVEGARGEIVVVAAGSVGGSRVELADAVAQVRDLAAGGVRLKDACAQVATATGRSKKELYDAAVLERRRVRPVSG